MVNKANEFVGIIFDGNIQSLVLDCIFTDKQARATSVDSVAILEALMTPLFIVFFKLRALGETWDLLPIALLGTWALVVNGSFFAAMSLRTRSREIMLPLLLFPISVPALLGMVNATSAVLSGEYSPRVWIALLLAYDVVFTIACLYLFETVLEAE